MLRGADRLLVLLLVGLLFLASGNLYAGRGDKSGTAAAPELLIPVGARDLAMGGASLAMTSGVDAIYWNPAGLARSMKNAEAMFSHMNYIADIGVEYVAVGASFEGLGAIGLSIKSISMGEFEVTTADVPDGTGEKFSPTFVTIGLTYSRLLTDRISVGLTTNLVTERIDRASASSIAFNFGVQYSNFASVNGLSIGVAVKNFGPAMTYDGPGLLREATATDYLRPPSFYKVQAQTDELPSTIELGVSYRRPLEEDHALTAAATFQNNNMTDDEYKLGLEYNYADMLFVRGGYMLSQNTVPDSYIYGATVGAGFHAATTGVDVTVDYTYRAVKWLDANHVFTVKLGF